MTAQGNALVVLHKSRISVAVAKRPYGVPRTAHEERGVPWAANAFRLKQPRSSERMHVSHVGPWLLRPGPAQPTAPATRPFAVPDTRPSV
jgi:hypothetical protein